MFQLASAFLKNLVETRIDENDKFGKVSFSSKISKPLYALYQVHTDVFSI